MMCYSECELKAIRDAPEFQSECDEYNKTNTQVKDLKVFINSIKLNSKYFRLSINTGVGNRKKFKNRNVGEDTIAIKEVNSYLNKLTDQTVIKVTKEIQQRLCGRDYLRELIMRSVIEKSLIHTTYIPIYLGLVCHLYGSDDQWGSIFEKLIDDIYREFTTVAVNSGESNYLQFCAKNKKLDKLIGHSLLITECEKLKIVKNKIHPLISQMVVIMKDESDGSEKYKCVQCLYNILKSLYGDSLLPERYGVQINDLIQTETSMKIKFKMMDMVDRK